VNIKTLRLPLLIACTLMLTVAHAQDVRSGEDVLRVMHDRYAKSWYETLTFTQKSTTYNPDGTTKVETWYEALALPGKLRIDVGPPSDGNGFLMVNGTLTILQGGKESGTRPRMNMLLVFGFDVYRQAPEATIKIAQSEGYDLTKFHEETWEGQPVYVVGAAKGDLKSKQFWVDKDRLLFVRLFEPTRTDPNKFQDVRFEDYRKLAGGWIAARVEVYVDDKKVFSEDYSEIQVDAKLDPGAFDPKQFNSTHWEKP
jgi:outer membrane lipoprotein-sorting protein